MRNSCGTQRIVAKRREIIAAMKNQENIDEKRTSLAQELLFISTNYPKNSPFEEPACHKKGLCMKNIKILF